MIYSFSPEVKREWFPSDLYPPEDESAEKRRLPGRPGNKFRWSDGFIEGFPIGAQLNELVQFDLESFLDRDADQFTATVNGDILQWDEQERIRLEMRREMPPSCWPFESHRKNVWKPAVRYCDRHVFLELTDKWLNIFRLRFYEIEKRLIAEKCFRGDSHPKDLSLWLLSRLGYFSPHKPGQDVAMANEDVTQLNELMAFIKAFSSLPGPLQTAEYFRSYCEKELHIGFRSYSPPHFEKALIALFETALRLLRGNALLRGKACLVTNGIDIETWIDERTVDLIQLCAGHFATSGDIPLFRLCKMHSEIVGYFSELVDSLKEGNLLSKEVEWYVGQGVALSERIDSCYKELSQRYSGKIHYSRYIEKHDFDVPTDFRVDSAIATSKILTNTFSAMSIKELIALMTYAAIKQGKILHICPQCGLPFIKMDNRQEYCTAYCRTEHAKGIEGKKAPSKICQNLECKAWHNPRSHTAPKPYSNYFKQLLDVLKHYWKKYQSDTNIDIETYCSWVSAFNVVKKAHLTEKAGYIKCQYGEGLYDPFFPLIVDNRLVAISFPVSSRRNSNLLKAIGSVEKNVSGSEDATVWNLSILKSAKGREEFPLDELIQLDGPVKRSISQEALGER